MNKYQYDKSQLKITVEDVKKTTSNNIEVEESEGADSFPDEDELNIRQSCIVVLMLIAMYVAIAALPTFIMMYFLNIGFWLSQLIVIIGAAIFIPLLGLHKPASKEQKMKSKFF